jgi:outer membrane immunogenic protein
MASVRGRFGYAADRWLVYVTGGAAWADINYRTNLTGFGLFNSGNFNTTKSGWTVGGGAEYAISQSVSAKLEYLYMDFGSTTARSPDGDIYRFENTLHSVKVGVNFKLPSF